MKKNSILVTRVIAAGVILAFFISGSALFPDSFAQETEGPTLSDGESKAIVAINTATDVAGKLTAAEAFVKKYPKSVKREDIARFIAGHIGTVTDATQKIALAERFQKAFTGEKDLDSVRTALLSAYITASRWDDAFNVAASILQKNPDRLNVLVDMTVVGTNEAQRGNSKYLAQSQQYGLKAIELIESNKKPVDLDDASWTAQKSALPFLYRQMAILAVVTGNAAEAKKRLDKSVALNPADPFNHVLLGSLMNDEYLRMAQQYKGMTDAKQKEETMKTINSLLDNIIETYARAVGLSEGKPEYKQLHDQVLEDLTPYFKYRHNGSTEGLQQLIDKYKVPTQP